jgi:NADH:ubiquinone oxidoreductase subunit 6 (subunit J)
MLIKFLYISASFLG